MIPSFEQRDEVLKRFARALFRRDLDALYEVVTPDFLWSFHDGSSVTKALVGRDQILAHLECADGSCSRCNVSRTWSITIAPTSVS